MPDPPPFWQEEGSSGEAFRRGVGGESGLGAGVILVMNPEALAWQLRFNPRADAGSAREKRSIEDVCWRERGGGCDMGAGVV